MLTETEIRAIKPVRYARKVTDGRGLYLLVRPTGTRSWRFAYRFERKYKTLSLGTYPEVTLEWARSRHEFARNLLAHCVDPSAFKVAYDIGLGTKRNLALGIRWYRRAARSGDSTATYNLATAYRDAGKATLAFQWWERVARMHDGDAAVDVGYCYQYGIGTRKSAANSKRMFRRAIASREISQYDREEAMYHLAVQFID